jgi:hypothetical protein
MTIFADHTTFALGDRVRKRKGSCWQGRVVGFYSTKLNPEGYCVESERERGSVQIYPAAALERVATVYTVLVTPDGEFRYEEDPEKYRQQMHKWQVGWVLDAKNAGGSVRKPPGLF